MACRPGETDVCPHCGVVVRFEATWINYRSKPSGNNNAHNVVTVFVNSFKKHALEVVAAGCPACGELTVTAFAAQSTDEKWRPINVQMWPDDSGRRVPPEVEADNPQLAEDFREAAAVFAKSKKASAALSRRCLQTVLTAKGGAKKRDLADQIDEVLPTLPSKLGENVDAIRQIGNYAAHPTKSNVTGEIVEVEEGEAEWLLDVLEELFDYYYVAPARAAAKRAALNAKLAAVGKPALKTR